MKPYLREREKQETISNVTGIVITVLVHAVIVGVGVTSGLTYIYPPPEEEAIVLDFSEDADEQTYIPRTGRQPRAVEPDPTREIELVQRSEGQHIGTKQNEAPEATVGDDGDVEVNEPPRTKEINRRALFHAADNTTDKDTLAPQTASEVSEDLKAGHASGTTDFGKEVGEPSARLKGRLPVNGYLPRPEYPVQKSGTVVVNILVDNYGRVTRADINLEKTTVTDNRLWQAAINAAKNAQFNRTMKAPPSQEGTITYVFKLK